jgi:SagB-type dehydrogenase family enzyme
MGRAVTAGALVAGLGHAIREFPLPARLRGTALALVPPEHGHERLEPSGAPIPLLGLAAGLDPETAAWRLASVAGGLRLAAPSASVGAGPCRASAVLTAVCAALEANSPEGPALLLEGWADDLRSPVHPESDADLACYLFARPDGIPLVGAVLTTDGAEKEIRVLGCGPSVGAALRRALDALLARAALAAWSEPGPPFDVAGEIGLASVAEVPAEKLGHLLGAEARIVHESDVGAIAQCRLLPRQGPPGPWAEPVTPPRFAPPGLSLVHERDLVRLSRAFHENSKIRSVYRTLPPVEMDRLHPAARRALAAPYRDYGRTRTEIPLPDSSGRALLPLDQAVRQRRSAAPMSTAHLPLADLARIMTLSAGITGVARTPGGIGLPLRATPSAGGLCSGDVFVLARRVDGLADGVHYFHPGRRVLQLVNSSYAFEDVAAHTGYPARVAEAAAIVVHVGAFRRNQWKYWERGYRMALLECGHLAQSVVVAAAALGLVAHPLIGFVDDYFNDLVGVNGVDDAVLYLTLLGGAVS